MNKNKEISVVVLKPKDLFYAWVTDVILTLKENITVDIQDIAKDNTALIVPHGNSSKEFSIFMLMHLDSILKSEFSRWTTDDTLWPPRFDIDLLMQYFDLHIHTSIIDYGQTQFRWLLTTKPKSPVKTWLKQVFISMRELPVNIERLDFSIFERNSTIYMLPPEVDSPAAVTAFLQKEGEAMFEFELEQLIHDKALWPDNRSIDLFTQWFDFDIYSRILTF